MAVIADDTASTKGESPRSEDIHRWLPWDRTTLEIPAGHALAEAEILFKKLDPVELFGEAND